jgi:hypothetical protein
MRPQKFHGRHEQDGRRCEAAGCDSAGEFRAPGEQAPGFDGPGDWRWLCLEHVREFNAGYDWFAGMTADEILEAQSPIAGWRRETRAFRADAGVNGVPRWADFDDPLEAIGARASDIRRRAEMRQAPQAQRSRFTPRERDAMSVMGLGPHDDLHALRKRYSVLVRRYHPDRNGGDRSHERKLQSVIEAYQLLRKAAAFA